MPNFFATVMPLLKAITVSAVEATGATLGAGLVVKVTLTVPGRSYCSVTVLVDWATTLTVWGFGARPSLSTTADRRARRQRVVACRQVAEQHAAVGVGGVAEGVGPGAGDRDPGERQRCASSAALTASTPRSSEIVPFGGATMLFTTTGGRLPMLGQVTVEVIAM